MLLSNVLKWLLPLFTIIVNCSARDTGIRMVDARKPLVKRSVEFQRARRPRNQWANLRNQQNQSDWRSFTPPTPNPEDVDCHIEIESVHVYDGICVRLGGSTHTAVCQSGVHLGFSNNNCDAILAVREASQATPPWGRLLASQSGSRGTGEH